MQVFVTPTEANKFLVLHGRKGTEVNGNYLYPAVGEYASWETVNLLFAISNPLLHCQ